MNKQDAPSSPAPVHRLVGQLRELLTKATPGPWCGPNPDNCPGHIECREIGYIGHLELHSPSSPFQRAHSRDDYALIVAAVNNIPALLAIVEIADQWNRSSTYEDSQAHLARLRTALRLLPNAQITGPGDDHAKH